MSRINTQTAAELLSQGGLSNGNIGDRLVKPIKHKKPKTTDASTPQLKETAVKTETQKKTKKPAKTKKDKTATVEAIAEASAIAPPAEVAAPAMPEAITQLPAAPEDTAVLPETSSTTPAMPEANATTVAPEPATVQPPVAVIPEPVGAAKPAVPVTPAKQPAAELPAEVDPLADIFAANDALTSIDVVGAITKRNTVLQSPKAVGAFIGAITQAQALAVANNLGRPEAEVRREWRDKNLAAIEKQLQERNDVASQKILAVFAAIRKTVTIIDAMEPLWEMYEEIIRPAQEVRSYSDLKRLMAVLASPQKKYLEVFSFKKNPKAIRVSQPMGHQQFYLPAMERGQACIMAEVGWTWLKEAETRALADAGVKNDKCDELAELDTGITPQEALHGEEGMVFIATASGRGCLFHIKSDRQGVKIRIAETVGMRLRPSNRLFNWEESSAWPDNADNDTIRSIRDWFATPAVR